MKKTAVEKMIQYFIEQKNNGASHWCIDDLIAQLHQAKEMEKEQMIDFADNYELECIHPYKGRLKNPEQYYNETFKSE